MTKAKRQAQMLTLLSGKGGSGKTVIGLAMSKVLVESGQKVLFVDCDMSTHGATYFFENELEMGREGVLTLHGLMGTKENKGSPVKTQAGFDFIPSTLSPAGIQGLSANQTETELATSVFAGIRSLVAGYDVVIFDCQAGYSSLALEAATLANRCLIVLEPDAVSSSALRVLFLQMGMILNRSNTWQIFNKLTEEERPVYEKLFGGTLFTNLPPIPFDWQVRGAFAVGEIPGITTQYSAFGLGVLRLLKTLFPSSASSLSYLESKTIGKWREFIDEKVKSLYRLRREIRYKSIEELRKTRFRQIKNQLFAWLILVPLLFIFYLLYRFYDITILERFSEQLGVGLAVPIVSAIALAFLFLTVRTYMNSSNEIRQEVRNTREREELYKIETELDKYKTLIATDPVLQQDFKRRIEEEDF